MMNKPADTMALSPSRRVAITSLMTAVTLVGEYALVAVPSVELGTTVLFLTGMVFGGQVGIPCAVISSLVFAMINPWGAFIPQIWFAQMIGWVYIVIIADLTRRPGHAATSGELALLGAALTLEFDLITDIGYSLAFGIPFFVAVIAGVLFHVVHLISNSVLFATVIPLLSRTIEREFGPQIWDISSEELTGEE